MTGRRVALYFVLFFGFIVTVNAVMVSLAVSTHSGLVTEHPYEKGLAYNRTVEAEQQQDALGWKARLYYKEGMLHFSLQDAKQQLLTLEHGMAFFSRPTQQGMDFQVKLMGADTPVEFPAKGLWEVRVETAHEGTPYQQSKRIVVE